MINKEITALIDNALAKGFRRKDLLLHITDRKHTYLCEELNIKIPFKPPSECIQEFHGVKVVIICTNYLYNIADFWVSVKY